MDMIIWVIIVALFVLSFVGLIFPILPGLLFIWVGFVLYVFVIGGSLSTVFWFGMVGLTVAIFLADIIANSYFVKRYGGSKWAERMAIVGVIVGAFIMPPFGIIIIPFLAVVITEIILEKDAKLALKIGVASIIAFLSSTFAKLIIQVIMIGWFLVIVILG